MGLIALLAVAAYVWVGAAVVGAVATSSVQCRAIPLFWLLAVGAAVSMPFLVSEPLPVRTGSEYGAFGRFLAGAFSHTNLACFFGAGVTLALSLMPVGVLRVASAASWGFLATFVARLVRLFVE